MKTRLQFLTGRLRSLLLGGAPGVSRRDIVMAHEVLFGGPPESEAVIRRYGHLPNRAALGRALMGTQEFGRRLARGELTPELRLLRPPIFLGDRVLAHTHAGDRIYLQPDDLDLAPHIMESGCWEMHVEDTIRRLLRPGQAAADIGANIGYHTLAIAAAVGPEGRVEAVEANPAVLPLLQATLFANGLSGRVRLHAAAAMDRPGRVTLVATPGHAGSGNIATTGLPPGHAAAYPQQAEVPAGRLDDLLADLPRLDLLRLDIEGAEPLALRGAEALIRRSPALRILTEWSVPMMAARVDLPDFVDWLAGLGFRFWRITATAGLEPLEPAATLGLPHCDLVLARDAPG